MAPKGSFIDVIRDFLRYHRDNIIKYGLRGSIFLFGGLFVAASFIFTYAYFTVGIPDPKAFVNSQSTIIQYADGTELGRIGSENRTIVPHCVSTIFML